MFGNIMLFQFSMNCSLDLMMIHGCRLEKLPISMNRLFCVRLQGTPRFFNMRLCYSNSLINVWLTNLLDFLVERACQFLCFNDVWINSSLRCIVYLSSFSSQNFHMWFHILSYH
uniref:Uncharacterized protein n=1 Tax=Opuntia streptacantha TaxID=393608 RepID=A0A7C8Z936_OPUST